MTQQNLPDHLATILARYQASLSQKIYGEENDEHDLLMDVFGITPQMKRENRQYWGRELGMCWQLLLTSIFHFNRPDFAPAIKSGNDEPLLAYRALPDRSVPRRMIC